MGTVTPDDIAQSFLPWLRKYYPQAKVEKTESYLGHYLRKNNWYLDMTPVEQHHFRKNALSAIGRVRSVKGVATRERNKRRDAKKVAHASQYDLFTDTVQK